MKNSLKLTRKFPDEWQLKLVKMLHIFGSDDEAAHE